MHVYNQFLTGLPPTSGIRADLACDGRQLLVYICGPYLPQASANEMVRSVEMVRRQLISLALTALQTDCVSRLVLSILMDASAAE